MTINEFIDILKDLTEQNQTCWKIDYSDIRVGTINEQDKTCYFCPITYVAYHKLNQYYDTLQADSAGDKLGLDYADIETIIAAADHNIYGKESVMHAVREKLKIACKLDAETI